MRDLLNEILARHTGQDVEQDPARHRPRLRTVRAEAKEYGIIDEVIASRELVDTSGAITAAS